MSVIVYLHILAATFLMGHMLFWAIAPRSLTERSDLSADDGFIREMILRSRWVSWGCLGVLILTGVSLLPNWHVTTERVSSGDLFLTRFGQVLGAKLLGVLFLMISSFFVGAKSSRLCQLNLFVGVMVVLLSVLLVR